MIVKTQDLPTSAVMQSYNPVSGEDEAERSQVQNQPIVHSLSQNKVTGKKT